MGRLQFQYGCWDDRVCGAATRTRWVEAGDAAGFPTLPKTLWPGPVARQAPGKAGGPCGPHSVPRGLQTPRWWEVGSPGSPAREARKLHFRTHEGPMACLRPRAKPALSVCVRTGTSVRPPEDGARKGEWAESILHLRGEHKPAKNEGMKDEPLQLFWAEGECASRCQTPILLGLGSSARFGPRGPG